MTVWSRPPNFTPLSDVQNNKGLSTHVFAQATHLFLRWRGSDSVVYWGTHATFFGSHGSVNIGPINVRFLAVGKNNTFPSVWWYSDKNISRIREDICNVSPPRFARELLKNLNGNARPPILCNCLSVYLCACLRHRRFE